MHWELSTFAPWAGGRADVIGKVSGAITCAGCAVPQGSANVSNFAKEQHCFSMLCCDMICPMLKSVDLMGCCIDKPDLAGVPMRLQNRVSPCICGRNSRLPAKTRRPTRILSDVGREWTPV